MTTIAYNHDSKVIACDGRTTSDGVILSDTCKKFIRKNDGTIWFFCGSVADREQLMELKHNDKPDVQPNCTAIYIKDGEAWLATFDGDYVSHCCLEYSHAIGSGAMFALSAMRMGKDAIEAVAFASTMDCYTGGHIQAFDIERDGFIKTC